MDVKRRPTTLKDTSGIKILPTEMISGRITD